MQNDAFGNNILRCKIIINTRIGEMRTGGKNNKFKNETSKSRRQLGHFISNHGRMDDGSWITVALGGLQAALVMPRSL